MNTTSPAHIESVPPQVVPGLVPLPATGELELVGIEPDGRGRFHVHFRMGDGPPRGATVPPAALESFKAFRRAVAKSCGVWPSWSSEELRPRTQHEQWRDEIKDAFEAGQRRRGAAAHGEHEQ